MPLLARQKRRLSALTASAALRADAAESALCGYLSIIALAGLVANAIWGITWADPAVALCLVPLVAREGWQTLRGNPCNCCCQLCLAASSYCHRCPSMLERFGPSPTLLPNRVKAVSSRSSEFMLGMDDRGDHQHGNVRRGSGGLTHPCGHRS